MKLNLRWIIIGFCLLLSSCASFTGNQVADVSLPNMQQYQNKPSVYIDLHFYWGEPNDSNPNERVTVSDDLINQFDNILKQVNLFEYYTFNKFARKPNDYVIKVNLYNHSSFLAVFPAVITGFSFYIIPSYTTDHYILTWQVISNHNQQVIMSRQNEDYMRTWLGIWFLPIISKTPNSAFTDTFNRQIKNMLKQMIDQQVFDYSINNMPMTGVSK